jgi:hypothetical protein
MSIPEKASRAADQGSYPITPSGGIDAGQLSKSWASMTGRMFPRPHCFQRIRFSSRPDTM